MIRKPKTTCDHVWQPIYRRMKDYKHDGTDDKPIDWYCVRGCGEKKFKEKPNITPCAVSAAGAGIIGLGCYLQGLAKWLVIWLGASILTAPILGRWLKK